VAPDESASLSTGANEFSTTELTENLDYHLIAIGAISGDSQRDYLTDIPFIPTF
jgi:hypothetical protein